MSISAKHYQCQFRLKKGKLGDLIEAFPDNASAEEIFADYGFEVSRNAKGDITRCEFVDVAAGEEADFLDELAGIVESGSFIEISYETDTIDLADSEIWVVRYSYDDERAYYESFAVLLDKSGQGEISRRVVEEKSIVSGDHDDDDFVYGFEYDLNAMLRAAKTGDLEKVVELADYYADDIRDNFEVGDCELAKTYYTQAHQAGHIGAGYRLGWLLAYNDSCKKNIKTGLKMMIEAYEKGYRGDDIAMSIGNLFESAKSVKNLNEAVEWFYRNYKDGSERAKIRLEILAEDGNANAQYYLAEVLRRGRDINSDPKALSWYEKAAESGHELAKKMLQK